jgi:hypothetical protein
MKRLGGDARSEVEPEITHFWSPVCGGHLTRPYLALREDASFVSMVTDL